MDLEEKDRRAYLRDEYLFIQAQYEDYDKRSLTIKGWVSSGSAAALVLSFDATHRFAMITPIIVAVIAGVFWYLETYWKLFQYALADRIRIIEAYFRDDQYILLKNPDPFQIYHFWFKSYSDEPIYEYEMKKDNRWGGRPKSHRARFWAAALQRFVALPYVALILMSVFCFSFLLWQVVTTPAASP